MVKGIANVVKNVMAGSHEMQDISQILARLASEMLETDDQRWGGGALVVEISSFTKLLEQNRETRSLGYCECIRKGPSTSTYVRFVQYLLEVGNKERA